MGNCCVPDSATKPLKNISLQKLRELSESQLSSLILDFLDVRTNEIVREKLENLDKQLSTLRKKVIKPVNLHEFKYLSEYFQKVSSSISMQLEVMKKFEVSCKEKTEEMKVKDKQNYDKFKKFVHSLERSQVIVNEISFQSREKEKVKGQSRDSMSQLSEKLFENVEKINNEGQDLEPDERKNLLKQRVSEFQKKTYERAFELESLNTQLSSQIKRLNSEIEDLEIKIRQKDKLYLEECLKRKEKEEQLQKQKENFNIKIKEISNSSHVRKHPSNTEVDSDEDKMRRKTGSVDGLKVGKKKFKNTESKVKNSLNSQIQRRSSSSLNLFLVNSSVIYEEKKEKTAQYKVLISNMFKIYGQRILRSEKIYAYDSVKPNNLSEYIKEQKNLLMIAKLTNGVIIGGFSRQSFYSKSKENQSFIFSIHPDLSFFQLTPKNEKKKAPVTLDKHFLVFGSNEIRIKCQGLSGYANIYGSAAIYENRSNPTNYEEFIGLTERDFEIVIHEVHEIQLDDIQHFKRKKSEEKEEINN